MSSPPPHGAAQESPERSPGPSTRRVTGMIACPSPPDTQSSRPAGGTQRRRAIRVGRPGSGHAACLAAEGDGVRFSAWLTAVALVSLLAGPCDVPDEGGVAPVAGEADAPVRGFVSVAVGGRGISRAGCGMVVRLVVGVRGRRRWRRRASSRRSRRVCRRCVGCVSVGRSIVGVGTRSGVRRIRRPVPG